MQEAANRNKPAVLSKLFVRSRRRFQAWLNEKGNESERKVSTSFAGNNVVPDGLPNKTGLKQWSCRCSLVAGAQEERFTILLEWGNTCATNAALGQTPRHASPRLAQHRYVGLPTSSEAGTEAQSIVDNTPGEKR